MEKTSPGSGSGDKTKEKKDIEGMYAKVMKKTKLFSTPSNANSINDLQNNNPDVMFVSDPDITKEISIEASPGKASVKSDNNYETIDKKRHRSSSFTNKDPGYETIPSKAAANSRMSVPVSLEYESLPDNRGAGPTLAGPGTGDPGYETLKRDSDYDPNYEVLRPNSDDGYAKIQENAVIHRLQTDGYSSIKSVRKLGESLGVYPLDGSHGYARIAEKLNNNIEDDGSDIYCSIPSTSTPGYATIRDTMENGGNKKTSAATAAKLSECSSLTGSDTDPNYESVRYLSNENPYERLESSPTPEEPPTAAKPPKDSVNDYFQVWKNAQLFKEWLA